VKLNDQGFVVVDEQRRTTDERIFAVGDVAGAPLLAHKAFREGKVAAEVIKGKPSALMFKSFRQSFIQIPSGVGRPKRGRGSKIERNVRVERYLWKFSSRAATMGSQTASQNDPQSRNGRILGVGICGRDTEGLISEGVLAIEMGATAQDLGLIIHPHPTLSEMMGETAELFTEQSHMSCPKNAFDPA